MTGWRPPREAPTSFRDVIKILVVLRGVASHPRDTVGVGAFGFGRQLDMEPSFGF
jgi:hypothetical protein